MHSLSSLHQHRAHSITSNSPSPLHIPDVPCPQAKCDTQHRTTWVAANCICYRSLVYGCDARGASADHVPRQGHHSETATHCTHLTPAHMHAVAYVYVRSKATVTANESGLRHSQHVDSTTVKRVTPQQLSLVIQLTNTHTCALRTHTCTLRTHTCTQTDRCQVMYFV